MSSSTSSSQVMEGGLIVQCISTIVQELITAYDSGKLHTIPVSMLTTQGNLSTLSKEGVGKLKSKVSRNLNLPTAPKTVDVIAAIPEVV